MTRKRFIKLLMSHGESKRQAQAIAYLYNLRGKSYKSAYADYVLKRSIRLAGECLAEAFAKFGLAIKDLMPAVERLKRNLTEGAKK